MRESSNKPALTVEDLAALLVGLPKVTGAIVVQIERPGKSPEIRFLTADSIVQYGAYTAIRVPQ